MHCIGGSHALNRRAVCTVWSVYTIFLHLIEIDFEDFAIDCQLSFGGIVCILNSLEGFVDVINLGVGSPVSTSVA